MASISRQKNGLRLIQFADLAGERKTIRLGKVSQRSAEGIKLRVEQLLEAKCLCRPMENELASWVMNLEPLMAKRFAAVGLITTPESTASVSLSEHLANYFALRTDVKPGTMINWRHTQRCLLAYFGADRTLVSITAGEARDWERWLKTGVARTHRYADHEAHDGLAANTVRKRVSNAKQFFQDAVSRDTLAKNPFLGLKGAVGSNRERDFFIDRDTAAKILDACPDAQWRLIFALSRFGGLRCPSEHLAMMWEDVDWARNRIRIRSPKTEHHEGKGERLIPLFPELRPHLEAAFDAAEPGTIFAVTRYRDASQNLRTTFQKIIYRAGVTPWPKLFQNLRASRATELASEHPAHVAAAWLGHSTIVASKHYWQVTDADFEKATKGEESTEEKALHKALQSVHAESRFDSQPVTVSHEQTLVLREFASSCEMVNKCPVGGTGFEPVTSTV